MQILNVIKKHQAKFRHTLGYRLSYDKKSVTINDQEEALLSLRNTFSFANLNIPGTDIDRCIKADIYNQLSYDAYSTADSASSNNEYPLEEAYECNFNYCQKVACKSARYAYLFAKFVTGADIGYCKIHAYKNIDVGISFIKYILKENFQFCKSELYNLFGEISQEQFDNSVDYPQLSY